MKAFLCILLSLVLLVGVISCGKNVVTDPIVNEFSSEALLNQAKVTFATQIASGQARTGNDKLSKLVPAEWQPQWRQTSSFKFDK